MPEELNADRGKINIRDLTDFIIQKKFINEGYNAWNGIHCKQFAQEIFDKVAAVGCYHWKMDEDKLWLKAYSLFAVVFAIDTVAATIGGRAAAAVTTVKITTVVVATANQLLQTVVVVLCSKVHLEQLLLVAWVLQILMLLLLSQKMPLCKRRVRHLLICLVLDLGLHLQLALLDWNPFLRHLVTYLFLRGTLMAAIFTGKMEIAALTLAVSAALLVLPARLGLLFRC